MRLEYDEAEAKAAAEAAVADFPPMTPEQAHRVAQLLGLVNIDKEARK